MSWWWSSHDETFVARPAQPADRPVLSTLLADTWRRQGPLAVEEQTSLLGNGLSTIAVARKGAVGFMGFSARRPAGSPAETWADLALAAVATDRPIGKILESLLSCALSALRGQGVTGLACLAGEGWLRDGLAAADFVQVDRVVGYAHSFSRAAPPALPVATLRPACAADIDAVLAVNAVAFEPFWQYDDTTILSWLLTSDHAALAEVDGQVAGFALTSRNPDNEYAYLIRLATLPTHRDRGIGKQLVADALAYARAIGAAGLALNTQASNVVSRRLYESLGFHPTGQVLSVMMYPVLRDTGYGMRDA
jgi:ribosomal protein S18 acetylase RimI-like enzyme